jgi:hypothetical protein
MINVWARTQLTSSLYSCETIIFHVMPVRGITVDQQFSVTEVMQRCEVFHRGQPQYKLKYMCLWHTVPA